MWPCSSALPCLRSCHCFCRSRPAAAQYFWNNFSLFANFVIWGLWFPLVFVSVIFTGRSWCGVLCPLGAASEWANRVGLKRPVPRWVRWRGTPDRQLRDHHRTGSDGRRPRLCHRHCRGLRPDLRSSRRAGFRLRPGPQHAGLVPTYVPDRPDAGRVLAHRRGSVPAQTAQARRRCLHRKRHLPDDDRYQPQARVATLHRMFSLREPRRPRRPAAGIPPARPRGGADSRSQPQCARRSGFCFSPPG